MYTTFGLDRKGEAKRNQSIRLEKIIFQLQPSSGICWNLFTIRLRMKPQPDSRPRDSGAKT